MKSPIFFGALLLACCACAAEPAAGLADAQVGDCVILREGGAGHVLKAPTYWLRGTVDSVVQARHYAGLCPEPGKPVSTYTREDWLRFATAAPCVENAADAREVTVTRLGVRAEDWDTPWSNAHGSAQMLFRGQFLDRPLKKGEIIEIDAIWLQRCEKG
jgi:hypothetical protein